MFCRTPSRYIFTLIVLCLHLLFPGAISHAEDYAAEGPYLVETRLETWTDNARNRVVPVKLYIPANAPAGPVVLFSHGLGSSRHTASYLGRRWASHGILSIYVQHPGTDISVLADLKDVRVGKRIRMMRALGNAAKDKDAAIARFQDIPFVIDRVEALIAEGELMARADQIGMAGHSYGAISTFAALGEKFAGQSHFRDDRLKAGLALSPNPVTESNESEARLVFNEMTTPLFHITGTKDAQPLGRDGEPEDRQKPFQLIPASSQYLLVFRDADHFVFAGAGGLRQRSATKTDEEVQNLTATLSTVWWKAKLSGDDSAEAWLVGGGAKSALREGDLWKSKE